MSFDYAHFLDHAGKCDPEDKYSDQKFRMQPALLRSKRLYTLDFVDRTAGLAFIRHAEAGAARRVSLDWFHPGNGRDIEFI